MYSKASTEGLSVFVFLGWGVTRTCTYKALFQVHTAVQVLLRSGYQQLWHVTDLFHVFFPAWLKVFIDATTIANRIREEVQLVFYIWPTAFNYDNINKLQQGSLQVQPPDTVTSPIAPPYCNEFSQWFSPGVGGGGYSAYERGVDARRKFWIQPLNETDLAVAQAFFDS